MTTLINEQYLKEYSPLPLNINIEDIMPYVLITEHLWIRPLIGITQYEELQHQVEDNNVTELNSTLLLKIYPLLSFATCFEALPILMYHISEVGITKGHSENSSSITNGDVNYINSHLRTQCAVLQNELIEWLEEHQEHYPLLRIEKPSTSPSQQLYNTNRNGKQID